MGRSNVVSLFILIWYLPCEQKHRIVMSGRSSMHMLQDGVWVTSSDYKNACPDPLRDVAEKLVNEINTNNMEDVLRFCNIYADLQFQVCNIDSTYDVIISVTRLSESWRQHHHMLA